MMPTKKRKGFEGFSTAQQFMNGSSSDIENKQLTANDNNDVLSSGNENNESKSISMHGGFSTASAIMKETQINPDDRVRNQQTKSNTLDPTTASNNNQSQPSTIHLTVRGIKYHDQNMHSLNPLTLHREPENNFGKKSCSCG